jgi:hypothetical protein
MTKVDKRDAAQRVMEFLREKNIRLKRADALELLAQVSEAPNWNVLQNAMRTRQEPIVATQSGKSDAVPEAVRPPEYVPDRMAVYTGQARVAYGWFGGIQEEMARICQEERQRLSETGNVEEAARWGAWEATVQRLAGMLEDIRAFSNYASRQRTPAQTLLNAQAWLETIGPVSRAVLDVLDARMERCKGTGGASTEVRKLRSRLGAVSRSASSALWIANEYKIYATRTAYLENIEALMGRLAESELDSEGLRAGCRVAHQTASAALLQTNNLDRLARRL